MICQWEVRYRNARGTSSSLFRSSPLSVLRSARHFNGTTQFRENNSVFSRTRNIIEMVSLDWSNRHDDRKDLRNLKGVSEKGRG